MHQFVEPEVSTNRPLKGPREREKEGAEVEDTGQRGQGRDLSEKARLTHSSV